MRGVLEIAPPPSGARVNRDFFRPILTLQRVFKGHFSRSLRNSDPKTCISALTPEMFFI